MKRRRPHDDPPPASRPAQDAPGAAVRAYVADLAGSDAGPRQLRRLDLDALTFWNAWKK